MKNWILVSVAFLGGCSSQFASTGEHVYQKAKNGSSIVLPHTSNSEDSSHYYDLPAPTQNAEVNIEPPED